MFSTFNVPALAFASQASLALYSSAKTSGIVVDCGHGASHVVPIYEGYVLPHAILSLNVSGSNLTDYMLQLLVERGFSFTCQTSEVEVVRDIKEKLCFVALDPDEQQTAEEPYELPGGDAIAIPRALLARCPEALFQPALLGRPGPGLHELAYRCVIKCDADIRALIYGSVALAGGGALFPGLAARLDIEMRRLYASDGGAGDAGITVTPANERGRSTWAGGSILASLASFQVRYGPY
jgi:actin-related protein